MIFKMRSVILLFSIFVFISSQAQKKDNKGLIIGTWKGVKKELKNGETGENHTFDGKPYKTTEVITLKKDGTGIEYSLGLTFTYSFSGDILVLGNRKYLIEKLTGNELVLLEYSDNYPDDPLAFRTYFVKEKKSS